MNDRCIKLKSRLEQALSMPFDLSSSIIDNEEQYTCNPSNSNELLFTVKAYIHDQIRLIVEINPQKNARDLLDEMSNADISKQKIFFQYIDILSKEKGRVHFAVNNEAVSSQKRWPRTWKFFKCRIDLLPIPEFDGEIEMVNLLAEWMIHGVTLILSLLTIEEASPQLEPSVQSEGDAKEMKSKRYERSRVNREICLAHKGYSCYVCGFNFLKKYGQLGKDYIEVHHTTPVSEMGDDYKIDIDRDLVPVCSNCHSMLHKKKPPFTIEELKEIIANQEDASRQG